MFASTTCHHSGSCDKGFKRNDIAKRFCAVAVVLFRNPGVFSFPMCLRIVTSSKLVMNLSFNVTKRVILHDFAKGGDFELGDGRGGEAWDRMDGMEQPCPG